MEKGNCFVCTSQMRAFSLRTGPSLSHKELLKQERGHSSGRRQQLKLRNHGKEKGAPNSEYKPGQVSAVP